MAFEPRPQIEDEGRLEKVVILLCSIAALAAGCASTPSEKARADMATFRREGSTEKLIDRGNGFAAIGDTTRAEEYLAAALEQGAEPNKVLPTLLSVCVQTGRYRSAIQHAENHLRKHPDDVRTRFVLGTLYAALGDAKEARVTLEHVAELRPNDSKTHYALAVLARDSENDAVAADRHFRAYLKLEPDGSHAEEARASLLKRMP